MADEKPPRRRYGLLSIVVAAVFGLFYAYDLWEAISTLFVLPDFYRVYGYDTAQLPWWLLILAVIVPVLVFVVAFIAGLRATIFDRALLFLVGLALSSAITLGLIALETVFRPALLSGLI